MSISCTSFRQLLEAALVGSPDASRLSGLARHEHVLGCARCRELLEGEESLEVLLALWPEEELSADRVARLVGRLREARRLEELLELDAAPVPEGLAGRVLAGLAAQIDQASNVSAGAGHKALTEVQEVQVEARLDTWLDAAGRVDPSVGLEARVIAGLRAKAPEAFGARSNGPPATPATRATRATRAQRPLWQRVVMGPRAAAAWLVGLGLLGLWRSLQPESGPLGIEIAMAPPPEELLSALPVLENWDTLFEDDTELAIGMDFTAEDEALLDFAEPGSVDERFGAPARSEGGR